MQRRLHQIATHCGCLGQALEDVARAQSRAAGLSSGGEEPSSFSGDEDTPELALDTMADVIESLDSHNSRMIPGPWSLLKQEDAHLQTVGLLGHMPFSLSVVTGIPETSFSVLCLNVD
jgi:hypothetical protein